MELQSYPKCCQAGVINYFGGGHPGESETYPTVASAVADIKIKMRQAKGLCVLFACPTSTQMNVVEALKELGWTTLETTPYYSYQLDAFNSKQHQIIPFMFDLSVLSRDPPDWFK